MILATIYPFFYYSNVLLLITF